MIFMPNFQELVVKLILCSIIHASLNFVQGRLLPWNTFAGSEK